MNYEMPKMKIRASQSTSF
jgi:serine/threonine protein kinase